MHWERIDVYSRFDFLEVMFIWGSREAEGRPLMRWWGGREYRGGERSVTEERPAVASTTVATLAVWRVSCEEWSTLQASWLVGRSVEGRVEPAKRGCVHQFWSPSLASSPSPCVSLVQSVKLSRKSCIMSVESLYESSFSVSNSAIASSNAWKCREKKTLITNVLNDYWCKTFSFPNSISDHVFETQMH